MEYKVGEILMCENPDALYLFAYKGEYERGLIGLDSFDTNTYIYGYEIIDLYTKKLVNIEFKADSVKRATKEYCRDYNEIINEIHISRIEEHDKLMKPFDFVIMKDDNTNIGIIIKMGDFINVGRAKRCFVYWINRLDHERDNWFFTDDLIRVNNIQNIISNTILANRYEFGDFKNLTEKIY